MKLVAEANAAWTGPSNSMLNDAEFVAGVRFEIVVRRQSLGYVDSKRLGKPRLT